MTSGRNFFVQILASSLVWWMAAAPIIWTIRDGLGPDMIATKGIAAAVRFLVMWGIPALTLGLPLIALSVPRRR